MKIRLKYLIIILFIITPNIYAQEQKLNTIDIDSLARKFKLEVSYNDISGDVILSDKRNIIKIIPGLSRYELNQKDYNLPRPISMVNGQIFIDHKVLEHLSRLDAIPVKSEKKIVRIFPKDFTVVIDPGHGGKDPGTSGAKGTEEKKVALAVGLLLKEELETMGATVLMTRSSDIFIPLSERPLLASVTTSDIFISLHLNSSKDSSSEGVEVFVYRYRDQEYENGRATAINQNISFKKSLIADDCYMSMGIENEMMRLQLFGNNEESNKLASSVLSSVVSTGNVANRGVKEANFVVLRNATCPSILVEMGFLSHANTEDKFLTGTFCKQVANRIADGIATFWKEK